MILSIKNIISMKTKAMHEGDNPDPRSINIGDDPVELAMSFAYRGSEHSNYGDLLTETNRSRELAAGVMRGLWRTRCWRRDILRCTKLWVYNEDILYLLLYAAPRRGLSKALASRVHGFESSALMTIEWADLSEFVFNEELRWRTGHPSNPSHHRSVAGSLSRWDPATIWWPTSVIDQFNPSSAAWEAPRVRLYSRWKDHLPRPRKDHSDTRGFFTTLCEIHGSWRGKVVLVNSTPSSYEFY